MTNYAVEVVLRDRDFAVTNDHTTAGEPAAWTELDVEDVLRNILRAIDRARDPEAPADRPVALRGFSWIVEPSEGGVVIAIEIPMGAAVAGPFAVDQAKLDGMITSVLQRERQTGHTPTSPTVH